MIKAVFFDIDGTLVSFKTHTIPQSTIESIELLKQKGIKVFIATGRALSQINNLGDLKFDGYILLNGSCSYDHDWNIIHKNPIPKSDIETFVNYQQSTTSFPCVFACDDELFICSKNKEVEEIEKLANVLYNPERDVTYALQKDVFQIVAFFDSKEEEYVLSNILTHCASTRWNSLFTDIIAKDNSKQAGIDKILEHYKINLSETLSFGDGGNDIPMLQHTAISFAMGNASDDVKRHATHVTDSVDDNGIWSALKKLEII